MKFNVYVFLFCSFYGCNSPQNINGQIILKPSAEKKDTVPVAAQKLMESYPNFIIGYSSNYIIWKDSTKMTFNDNKTSKSYSELLNEPSLSDQMSQKYIKGNIIAPPEKNYDPGRIRYEPFFYKMYGASENEVSKKLVEIIWCPKLVGQKIKVTTINGIDKKVKAISDELDQHPELKEYLMNIGGTFNWRKINGSKRQSTHSFGMTIDINTKYSNYWQWDCKCTNEDATIKYKNRVSQIIIDIFEKNGFIWGGKWYHFDTMHFEYRPELLSLE